MKLAFTIILAGLMASAVLAGDYKTTAAGNGAEVSRAFDAMKRQDTTPIVGRDLSPEAHGLPGAGKKKPQPAPGRGRGPPERRDLDQVEEVPALDIDKGAQYAKDPNVTTPKHKGAPPQIGQGRPGHPHKRGLEEVGEERTEDLDKRVTYGKNPNGLPPKSKIPPQVGVGRGPPGKPPKRDLVDRAADITGGSKDDATVAPRKPGEPPKGKTAPPQKGYGRGKPPPKKDPGHPHKRDLEKVGEERTGDLDKRVTYGRNPNGLPPKNKKPPQVGVGRGPPGKPPKDGKHPHQRDFDDVEEERTGDLEKRDPSAKILKRLPPKNKNPRQRAQERPGHPHGR